MSMSNQRAGGSDEGPEAPDMSLYEDETSNATGDEMVEAELAAPDAEPATPDAELATPDAELASPDAETSDSADTDDADMGDAASAPEAEASDDTEFSLSTIELKYPEIYAEMMALQDARNEFDIVRQDLSDRAARNREDLLNLLRIRRLNAHFADILGGGGVYNDQEIVNLTEDPLLDAEFERVMQDIRDMRRDVAVLAVRHATLAEWAKEIREKQKDARSQELANR
ncbi:hypothetical protein BFW01_g3057 [Lasiodiplodia theobromae]|uniref:Uncharacterized protein n=1 Tax=Lasiodiplodia theobromae TaxID=45133 RepID=A0A5N5DQM3_9PEZI|nr:hypothetical protein DBV05_g1154 [Lasiodiplodia theobromae]KAF9632195.1 hypothetical protein BFW01_g3057 [Lasiodiplodia theobromae]